jgi:hypothetical protein
MLSASQTRLAEGELILGGALGGVAAVTGQIVPRRSANGVSLLMLLSLHRPPRPLRSRLGAQAGLTRRRPPRHQLPTHRDGRCPRERRDRRDSPGTKPFGAWELIVGVCTERYGSEKVQR